MWLQVTGLISNVVIIGFFFFSIMKKKKKIDGVIPLLFSIYKQILKIH